MKNIDNNNSILEIFSDYVWPWCYFITGRIEKLKRNYEIDIRWIAFPLHPDTPSQGLTLEELFAGRPIDVNQLMQRLQQVAAEEGLPFGKRTKTYNSRLAQELSKWAESEGKGDQFHDTVFKAYFAEGKNIGLIETLVEVARSVGLSDKDAQTMLETRAYREAVDRDWSRSRLMGVTAVPTFVINQQAIVGAQPYEVLEQFLKANQVSERIAGD